MVISAAHVFNRQSACVPSPLILLDSEVGSCVTLFIGSLRDTAWAVSVKVA